MLEGILSLLQTQNGTECLEVKRHPESMRDPRRAVLIDDNPDDRALVMRELRREFPDLAFDEVADSKGFNRILKNIPSDLIITDFQLRWTDGLKILRTVKSLWPDCPVIMFTGTGSEEIAVAAMKAGLDDYVLKSPTQYARLPGAAKLALSLAEQKRLLKEAEARYGNLFDSVPIGLYRATPDGRILEANAALGELLQYRDPAELRGRHFREIFAEAADYERWKLLMDRQRVVQNFEARLRRADGEICWAMNSARAVFETQSHQTVFEGSLEDTSERKRAEDEREGLIQELQQALATLKTLSGLLPICASCKKIRDDSGCWNQLEVFIQNHSDAEFTHSFCPDCARQLYPEVFSVGQKSSGS